MANRCGAQMALGVECRLRWSVMGWLVVLLLPALAMAAPPRLELGCSTPKVERVKALRAAGPLDLNECMRIAVDRDRAEVVAYLLKEGVSPDLVVQGRKPTPIVTIAARDARLGVLEVLLKAGANVHPNDGAFSPLTSAVHKRGEGGERARALLLAAGADPNRGHTKPDDTPIRAACWEKDRPEVAAQLVAAGATLTDKSCQRAMANHKFADAVKNARTSSKPVTRAPHPDKPAGLAPFQPTTRVSPPEAIVGSVRHYKSRPYGDPGRWRLWLEAADKIGLTEADLLAYTSIAKPVIAQLATRCGPKGCQQTLAGLGEDAKEPTPELMGRLCGISSVIKGVELVLLELAKKRPGGSVTTQCWKATSKVSVIRRNAEQWDLTIETHVPGVFDSKLPRGTVELPIYRELLEASIRDAASWHERGEADRNQKD